MLFYNCRLMAPLSAAEKQKRYRQRLKEKANYDQLKERECQRARRNRNFTGRTSEIRAQERKRKVKLREKTKKMKCEPCSPATSFSNRASLSRALKRVNKALPLSPKKKAAVVGMISINLFGTKSKDFLESIKNQNRPKVSQATKDKVIAFYNSDSISRQAPGKKDNRAFKVDGKTERIQLRYMNMLVREAHELYLEKYPDQNSKIGRSYFYNLKPINIKFTHEIPRNVCVCVHHEFFRLKLVALGKVWKDCPATTGEFIASIVCDRKNEECMSRRCVNCPSFDPPVEYMLSPNELKYEEWTPNQGTMTKSATSGTFASIVEKLINKLETFAWHCYIKDKQSEEFERLRATGTPLLQVDFSENYACEQQNEIQSAHWQPPNVTIFPAVFWKEGKAQSFAIVSDTRSHEKETVYSFLKHLVRQLTNSNDIPKGSTLHIFSDGCAGQFKCKFNFFHLEKLSEIFEVKIMWHFFASCHGKGAVDGVGGKVKMIAAHESRLGVIINTAEEFCKVLQSKSKIEIIHIPAFIIEARSLEVKNDYSSLKTIKGTQKLHTIWPMNRGKVGFKAYSSSEITSEASLY